MKAAQRPENFLGYNAIGHKGLEGAHRATETSCVPLQESTAHRCVFFVYRHQAFPRRERASTRLTLKAWDQQKSQVGKFD